MTAHIDLKEEVTISRLVRKGIGATMVQLSLREWRRLLSEPSRVIGILVQPLLFLAVFGLGFHSSFRLGTSLIRYVDFFFPGILGLVVLFSSIYATLTLVDDKRCGLFKLILVGPSGVAGAVLGKVFATFSLGLVQSLLFLPLAYGLGISISLPVFFKTLLFLVLGSLVFSLIGVCFAWVSPSPSAFHALMSVILIPMWLLSGAMFPLDGKTLSVLGMLNPMSYLVSGLRVSLLHLEGSMSSNVFGLTFFLLLAALLLILAVRLRPIE